jgi:hypothetical protein
MRCRKYSKSLAVLIASASILFGCYPKAVGPVGPGGEQLTWPEMGLEQRKEHMRKEILPRAADLFGEWRPDRFAKVDCSLCHRRVFESENFKMPNADLPRLSGELLLGPEFSKFPETTKLKLDRLVPAMSKALGLKPFSIVTRTGFGCYSCHLGPKGPMFGN